MCILLLPTTNILMQIVDGAMCINHPHALFDVIAAVGTKAYIADELQVNCLFYDLAGATI